MTPGNTRRLATIALRSAIRAEAGLNPLDVLRELKLLKRVEDEQVFQRWSEPQRHAVLVEILERRRAAGMVSAPNSIEGMYIGAQIRSVLWQRFIELGRPRVAGDSAEERGT